VGFEPVEVLMESVETQLPSSPTTPQLARGFLRAALQTWELDGFGAVTELLATELVSNVVTHVGKPMTLRVTRDDDSMTVEVDDPSPELPTMRHPGVDDEHGRGILLVNELANSWGAHPRVDGKTVWFALDVSTAIAEAHEGG
jgi:anti-sigma regulatory factor (Ser/Thr protein kinase)